MTILNQIQIPIWRSTSERESFRLQSTISLSGPPLNEAENRIFDRRIQTDLDWLNVTLPTLVGPHTKAPG